MQHPTLQIRDRLLAGLDREYNVRIAFVLKTKKLCFENFFEFTFAVLKRVERAIKTSGSSPTASSKHSSKSHQKIRRQKSLKNH